MVQKNVAAHAFSKYFESLQLLLSVEEKIGRLVGATDLEMDPVSKTDLMSYKSSAMMSFAENK